jgi:hypothetical protein
MKLESLQHKVAHTGKLGANGEDNKSGKLMISPPRVTLKSLHNEREGLITKRALKRGINVLVEIHKSRFYALFIYLFIYFV